MKALKYSALGFSDYEKKLIYETLNDPRGWYSLGYKFVERSKNYDFLIKKKTTGEINNETKSMSLHNLSVTFKGYFETTEVWINRENWNSVPINFTGTHKEYRQYLVQHEIGHVLGYDHVTYRVGRKCPVMYQQTKGTLKCKPNPWIFYDNDEV